MGVVEQRVVPVAPRKRLGPDAQVGVGVELWSPVLLDVVVVLLLLLPAVVGGGNAHGDGRKQGDVAPGVGETDGVMLLCFNILDVGARGASPRSPDTPQTDTSERRHFLHQFLRVRSTSVIFQRI